MNRRWFLISVAMVAVFASVAWEFRNRSEMQANRAIATSNAELQAGFVAAFQFQERDDPLLAASSIDLPVEAAPERECDITGAPAVGVEVSGHGVDALCVHGFTSKRSSFFGADYVAGRLMVRPLDRRDHRAYSSTTEERSLRAIGSATDPRLRTFGRLGAQRHERIERSPAA